MAINFLNPYATTDFSSTNNIITTVAYTVPVNVDALYIFVYADIGNSSVVSPNLVEWNSISATLVSAIPTDAGNTGQVQFIYKIVNPTAATGNIRVRHALTRYAFSAVCLSVDDAYIETVGGFNYATGTSPSISITSALNNKTLYSLTANGVEDGNVTETGGQTKLIDGGTWNYAYYQLATETASSTSNSATWTLINSQRWSAVAINFAESVFYLDTITNPLVPNAAFSGTCTGYADGAATISFGGVSIPVTIALGAFSGTVPMIADNVAWPKLPATNQPITLTQAGNLAVLSCDISLPSGYETVRNDFSVVSDFAGIIADDNTYLQYHFAAASNPLTTNDTAVFPTSGGYLIYQDTGVGADSSSLPRTDTIYIYRGASGKYFEHGITVTESGAVVITSTNKNHYIGLGFGVGF